MKWTKYIVPLHIFVKSGGVGAFESEEKKCDRIGLNDSMVAQFCGVDQLQLEILMKSFPPS